MLNKRVLLPRRGIFSAPKLSAGYKTVVPASIKNAQLFEHRGFINGEFTTGVTFSGETFPVTNPANGQIISMLPRMRASDVKEAASASMRAWKDWKATTAKDRSRILHRMADLMIKYEDDLAAIITLEAGKPLMEARGEIIYARSFLEFFAEEAMRSFGEILPSPVKGEWRKVHLRLIRLHSFLLDVSISHCSYYY
jgi:acyl-CoA reductase-like NAD-dependent aldehyde dehydrogenase